MSTNGSTQGSSALHIPLRPGVLAPVLTIFKEDEELDLVAQKKHAVRLAEAGLVGLVVMGSNGEAVHLDRAERISIISATRSALDEAGHKTVPVIAGCTEQGVRGSIELCREAQKAGASYAMILPPCYYRAAMTNEVIYDYFTAVADKSPIPILMYNYPGAVAGVDMDSDLMIKIASHKNVLGAKFTCANTGKLTRVAAATKAISPLNTDPSSNFLATGGMADIIVQTYVSGGSGVIAGTANVIPKFCVSVWNLCAQGNVPEAMKQQVLLSKADAIMSKTGIPGTKSALQDFAGYGGVPRRPLPTLTAQQAKAISAELQEAYEVERVL